MSIEKNIHNVGVVLGITKGKVEEDGDLEELSAEWFKEKSKEFPTIDEKANEIYATFKQNYGPIAISKVNGESLLKTLFLGTGNENMCHCLEYISTNTELFGSIKGGNAYKYPLHFESNTGSWKTGTQKNQLYLALDEAIKIGEKVRHFLVKSCELIESKLPISNVEGYIELYAALYSFEPNLVDNIWFSKYLHMIFPNVFPTFYNKNWQEEVLGLLKENPSDCSFGRMGQIIMFIDKCQITPVLFNKVYFTYARQYLDNPICNIEEDSRKTDGKNIIYYGTPGCGKSYYVDNLYNTLENKVFRTVFHPEYSNADFIGQIIPQIDKEDNSRVTYSFKTGVFTQALEYALKNPSINVYLIIEEINRGNASAIFGEVFQLLDRKNGKSVFEIKNDYISEALGMDSEYSIFIPSNLSLIATMNTSDQNVYTLDTAFKRRWEMIKIRNSFDFEANEYKSKLAQLYIPGSKSTWKDFVTAINKKISNRGKTFTITSEDKELGVYFVGEEFLSEKPNDASLELVRRFGEKV